LSSVISYRIELWGLAWSQFLASPLTGIGAGALADYLAAHDSVIPEPIHAHNLYLQILASWGLSGAIKAQVAAFVTTRLVLNARDVYPGAFLAALLVDGFGDYVYWFWPMTLLIIAEFAVLLFSIVELEPGADAGRPAPHCSVMPGPSNSGADLVADDAKRGVAPSH